MVKSTVTSGSSKVFATIFSQKNVLCLILEQEPMIMPLLNFISICFKTRHAEDAVARLRSTSLSINLLQNTWSELPSTTNTNLVTLQIRPLSHILDLYPYFLVPIACLDGMPFKADRWRLSSSW